MRRFSDDEDPCEATAVKSAGAPGRGRHDDVRGRPRGVRAVAPPSSAADRGPASDPASAPAAGPPARTPGAPEDPLAAPGPAAERSGLVGLDPAPRHFR